MEIRARLAGRVSALAVGCRLPAAAAGEPDWRKCDPDPPGGVSQEWWAMWSTSLTPGGAGVSGPLISGPITNEEMENIAAKTPSAIAGAHQFENLRRSLISIGMEAIRPRTPKSAVPPTPATRAVPTNGPMWCST